MARQWTEGDKAAMDQAANDAEEELALLIKSGNATAEDILIFHSSWYLTAGHKRLGRLYVEYAKRAARSRPHSGEDEV